MFGRKSIALGMMLVTQLLSGCWCCHRPFFCCGGRFYAPMGDCSSCYQPNGGAVQTYPTIPVAPMNYMRTPSMPNAVPAPTNTAPGTIPSFPASTAGTFTSLPVR
ncbi:MAG TPA: hypothetical protein VL371_01815 [Gemmataceae bacterium]|jgi:hypothetical protein|nr:hypothetical protein [Gemmataceae bacterium]